MNASRPSALAAEFEGQRTRLTAVAYRMLGSRPDAEDAVQEAWLRLSRQDPTSIENLAGWLTTVVGRVCIDMLRSRARLDRSFEGGLPELAVIEDDDGAPEDEAILAESVGLALLIVLDTLGPDERLAFVLHDLFAVPFEEVGAILGKSADASKMLASRARRKVQGADRPTAGSRQQQRAVVDAFLAAARDGDFERLLGVLDPGVVWRTHTARGVIVRLGATEVAAKAVRGIHSKTTAGRALVNGEPGIVSWDANHQLRAVMSCTVVDGRIVEMVSVTDPERLTNVEFPGRLTKS